MELCVTDENMYEQNNISDSENDVTYDGNFSVKSNSEPCKLISYIILNDEASSARYSDCEGLPELANVTDSEVTSDGRSDEILACVSSSHVSSRSSSHETITKTENGCAMTQEAGKSDLLHDSCESRENSDSLSNVSMMRTPTCLEDKSLDKNSSCTVTDTTDANFEVLHASSVDNESIVETISYSLQEESKANVMDKIEHGNVLDLSSPIDNGSQVTSDKIDGFGGIIIYEDCSTVNSELENNGIENCCSNDANIVSRSTDQKTSDNGHSSAKYAIDVMRDKDAIILVSDTKINDDTTENREFEINVESDKIDVPCLEKFSERSVYSSSETHTTDNKAVDCTATEKDLEKLHHHDLIKHEYSNLSQITGDINLEPVCNKPNHVYELSLKCNQSDFMIIKNESPNVVPPSPQSKLPFLKSKMYMNNSDITTQPEKSNRSKWLKSKWFNKGKSLYKGLGMPYSSRSTEFPQLQGFKSEKGSPVSILSINPIFECDSSSSEVSSTYSSCDTIRGSDVTGSLSSSTGSSTIDVASSCSKSSSTSSFSSSSTTRSLTSRNILDKEAARNASGVTADEQMHLLSHMHASHGQKHEKQSSSGGMLKGYDVTSFADTEASATQMLLLLQCSGCGRREDCSIGGTYATCDCESKNSGIKESSDCAEICVKCGKEKGSGDRVYICGICIKNLLKRRLSVTSEESGYSKKLRHHSSLPNLTDDDCVFPVYEDKQLKYWVDPGGNFICYPSEASSVEPLETVDELEICRRSSNLKAFTSDSVEVLDDYSPSPILKNHLKEIIHKVSNIAETSHIQNTTMEDRFENRNSEASASVLSSKDQDCKMLRNFQTDDHGHNNLTGSCDKMLQHHAECKQTDSGISLMRESVDSISEIGEYNCATYAFESPSRRGHFRGSVKSSTSSSGSLPDVTVTPPPDSGPSSPSSRPTSGAHKTFSNVKKRLAKTRRRHLSSLIGPDVSPEPSTDRALKVGHHSERRSSLVHLATFGLSKLQSYAHGHSNNNNNNSDKKSDRSKKSNSGQVSFGKRSGGSGRRTNECLILESSSVIAFDYPDVQNMRQGVRHVQVPANNNQSPNVERLLGLDPDLQQHRHNLHHHNQHNINVHGGGHQQSHRVPSNGAIIRSSSNPPPLTHHSIPSQLIPDGGGGTTTHMAGSHHIHHHPPHHTQQQHHHHHHNHHQQQQQILQSHNYHHSQQQHAIMTNPQSTSVNIHVPGGPPTNATHNNSTSHQQQQHTETYLPDLVRSVRSRGSVASGTREGGSSDTSSAYSGSDTMCHSVHSLDHEDVDLSGLQESAVDSDEEDLAESMETMMVRDAVRECLEKDPSMRTEDDIKVLLEFTQRLKAFADKTLAVRKAMCQAMVFAVVEKAGTILMNDNEELDSWSVIINGYVEVTYMDQTYQLHLGDSFGIPPTMEKLFHRGVMVSMVDDCQFVCIRQSEYFRILHQGEENTLKIEENGQTVLVMEHRQFEANNRKGHIVIKGTPERLMAQLVEVENYIDPTYVEDFLLTHRTFLESPLIVANKLLQWFENPTLRNLVTRVVLLWVNNHFTDFEMDPVMMNFLEQFEEGLERCKMDGQLRLLDFACAAKARSRTVTLTRPSRDEILHFSILGGYKKKCGIFISKVEKGSKAEEVGLKRGDQILEVNGKSFEHIDHTKALELLRSTCHLAITVKSNLLAFKEMLQTPENSPCPHSRKTSDAGSTHSGGGGSKSSSTASDFASTLNLVNTLASPRAKEANSKAAFMNLKKHWFKDAIKNLLPKNSNVEAGGNSDDSVSSQSSLGGPAFHSHSNPDLTALPYDDNRQEFPEHVLKVYRASDQSAKFLPVNQETTAREVVMLSLQIFNINDPSGSSNYALYEVTVTEEGIRKQKRLPDSLQNLAERIGLSSRYYLKKMDSSQNLVPDEIVNELIKEAQVTFLQLNSVELAIQLTLEDFAIFRQIEPTEYIDDLFNLKSKYGTPALSRFADLVNKEMFWVVTEVCSESNVVKRSKIVKQFIKVARQCKECKNFNSMFNILCGLGHRSVSRLRSTWERVPSKYMRLFHELQDLMDPSRNMSKYRNLIHDDAIQPPCIPFYPVVSKDLRFAHDGNKESCKGLINFETLRMISRYIRDMQNMCSTPYDLVNMVESGGQAVSTAMFSMNQMSAGQQHNTVKRRNKSTTTHDKKKMFEEAQMVRRVKTYLAKLTVTTDEDELEKKSYQCEPGLHQNTNSTTHHSATLNNTNSSTSSTTTTTTSTSSGASTAPSNSAPPSSNPQRRRPHSPTPSTTSSTSSTSHTSDGRNSSKFGAKSPQSMRKMMALAENKTKPYHGPRPSSTSSLGHHSPGPSPRPPRRRPTGALAGELANITTSHLNAASNLVAASNRNNHERSHSDTPAVPVDLSAESSSVTSLSNIRKSLTQGCMNGEGVLSHCDADSGISTHYDGSGSLDGGDSGFAGPPSPPPHHRRYSQQPEYYRRSCTSYQGVHVPPFLNAVPVLPPLPSSYAPLPPPGCPPRRRGTNSTPVAPPPDYSSTQMRLMMGRTMSHDAAVQYYIAPPPSSGAPAVQHRSTSQAEDDDEDAQVSTV